MGTTCASLPKCHQTNRYNRTRSRSQPHTIDFDKFPRKINIDEKYNFDVSGTLDILEEGASGRVVKGTQKNNKENNVAIKIMSKRAEHGNETPKSLFQNEVDILRRINHKNVVRLIDIGEDESNYYIVLGLGKGGDLVDCIFNDNYHINEDQAALWVRTMLQTLKYLHSQNIVHCDLKPENIVFESHKGGNDIIFIDFGLAKLVDDNTIYNNLCANKWYTPPEIAQHYLNLDTRDRLSIQLTGKVWKCADIWAVGIITYIMVTKKMPFFSRTNKGIFEKIVNDKLTFPDSDINTNKDNKYSIGFRDFVERILCKNPYKRITIDEALQHQWIKRISPLDIDLNLEVIEFLRQYGYQSKLKQWVTSQIAEYEQFASNEIARHHFDRLDKNNDGVLDKKEFEDLLLNIGYDEYSASEEAQKIIFNADLDNDGYIDFREFKRLWHRKLLYDEIYINTLFDACNDERQFDGYIDAKEIQLRFGGNLGDINQMIDEWDIDRDRKLSLNDFKKAMKEHPSQYLVYGYIRSFICDYSLNVNICNEINVYQSHRTKVKKKLIVIDGNLYYNFALKSHLSFKENTYNHPLSMKIINIDDIPSLIINTIIHILANFEITETIKVSMDGRTQNLLC